MSKKEKKEMLESLLDEFFDNMGPNEKKDLLNKIMPKMIDKMMEGMSKEDKKGLMKSVMPTIMSQMFRKKVKTRLELPRKF